jgi:hypothetical protein
MGKKAKQQVNKRLDFETNDELNVKFNSKYSDWYHFEQRIK